MPAVSFSFTSDYYRYIWPPSDVGVQVAGPQPTQAFENGTTEGITQANGLLTLTVVSSPVLNGSKALRLVPSGSNVVGPVWIWGPQVDAVAGATYVPMAAGYYVGSPRTLKWNTTCRWYNAAGQEILSGGGNSTETTGGSTGWHTKINTFTAPTGAVKVCWGLHLDTQTGAWLQPTDVFYIDGVGLEFWSGANGRAQAWTVPNGVTSITIECKGAAGGGFQLFNNRQVAGGRVKGTFAVTPGETLWVYVGGAGEVGNGQAGGWAAPFQCKGGWNGGGDSGTWYRFGYPGFGGGGATDVRRGGQGLSNRIIVAGGGGGSGGDSAYTTSGRGGGLEGGNSLYNSGGGTQTAGGAGADASEFGGPAQNGSFGQGGNGTTQTNPDPYYGWGIAFAGGAGGGGGWYGGGGGACGTSTGINSGMPAGGGSGYTSPDATNVEHTVGGGNNGPSGGGGPTSGGHGSASIVWEIDPQALPESIVNFGTNTTPQGYHLRVGEGQWTKIPQPWSQFLSKAYWNGEYYLSGGSTGKTGKSYDLRRWSWRRVWFNATVNIPRWNGEYWMWKGDGRRGSAKSYDGENWTYTQNPEAQFASDQPSYATPIWGDGKWVVGDTYGNIYSSSDGLNWTLRLTESQVAANPNGFPDTQIAWTNNYPINDSGSYMPGVGFVLLGRSRSALSSSSNGYSYWAKSTDGISWTWGRMLPNNDSRSFWATATGRHTYAIANNGTHFVAVGTWVSYNQSFQTADDRPLIWRSTNGTSWEWIDPGPHEAWDFQHAWGEILWTGSVFIAGGAGGSSGENYECTSPDGVVWSVRRMFTEDLPYYSTTPYKFYNTALALAPTGTNFEEHPWQVERWAGHNEHPFGMDGTQPYNVRFSVLGSIAYDRANSDVIASDIAGSSLGLSAGAQYYRVDNRFVRLNGKTGTTFLRIKASGDVMAQGTNTQTVNAQGTGTHSMYFPIQMLVSPNGRYLITTENSIDVIHRIDLEQGTARLIWGAGNATDSRTGQGAVSRYGLVGFGPDDGYLYTIGPYTSLDCFVRRIEGWDTESPYSRTLSVRDWMNSSTPFPAGPLSLRAGCFMGNEIWAIDGGGGRNCLYRIPPPYTRAYLAEDPDRTATIFGSFFDTPTHITAMGKMLYVADARGNVAEIDPENPQWANLIAGNGDNINGQFAGSNDMLTGTDALDTRLAALYGGMVNDGRGSIYIADTNQSQHGGMHVIQRLTQGGGIPSLRLRQRDDNPK